MRLHKYLALLLTLALPLAAAGQALRSGDFDVLIKGGMVYDGTGRAPRRVDVAIKGDRIVAIGNLKQGTSAQRGGRAWSRRRARLYQHAVVVHGVSDR